jgi:hypothetical protein
MFVFLIELEHYTETTIHLHTCLQLGTPFVPYIDDSTNANLNAIANDPNYK